MANSRNSASPEPLLQAVVAALHRHLPQPCPGMRLAAGLSGGRDSVALLFALKEVQADFAYTLSACHVHHGLSPHADAWQAHCQALCDRHSIPLQVFRVHVPPRSREGLEAAARRLRYEAYARLEADWLMLAQHQGDQAETLLFNLLRGSGVAGARGMPEVRPVREGLRLMRPCLGVGRADIDRYLKSRNLPWVEDESNEDERFSRNFLRHRVFPVLQQRFPAAEARLAATAAHLSEAGELLDELALADLAGRIPEFPLPVSVLAGLPEARGRNLLRYLLGLHRIMIPGAPRLREALRQLCESAPDRHPEVAFGQWRLIRVRGEIVLKEGCLQAAAGTRVTRG